MDIHAVGTPVTDALIASVLMFSTVFLLLIPRRKCYCFFFFFFSLEVSSLKTFLEFVIIIIIILLLIARKLPLEYDQMRVTSRIPKNYIKKKCYKKNYIHHIKTKICHIKNYLHRIKNKIMSN